MRKKRIALWAFAAVVLAAAVIFSVMRWSGDKSNGTADWQDRAEAGQMELQVSFWDDKREMFNNAAPCLLQLCTDPFNYWWQAHAVDTLTDGYLRSGEDRYMELQADLYQGILNRNAGVFPNDYYDDMEWMALAWLRAYEAVKTEAYKDTALLLWEDIKTGWNEEGGGGIAWRKEQLDYKNTPANAPAAILAARLYQAFGNDEDLEWAKRIYDWQKTTLVDPESGLVWDGMNRLGDGMVDTDWRFTYNQGVYIGAGVELYKATGDKAYLADAARTVDYVLTHMTNPSTGMLPSEGDGDGALFKGVLVRYLGEYIRVEPEASSAQEVAKLITVNAESLWDFGRSTEAGKTFFSNSWAQTPDQVVQLATQLSGVMLLEQAARLTDDKNQ